MYIDTDSTSNILATQNTAIFVGSVGTVIGFLFVLSPIPAVIAGVRDRKFKTITYTFLITGILNNIFWVFYGLKVDDFTVITSSALNTFFLLIYLYIFLLIERSPIETFKNTMFIVLITIVDYVFFPATITGLVACGWNIANYVSPLETLIQAIKDKDHKYINVAVTVMSGINSIVWLLYGVLAHDLILILPPLIGVLVFLCQMAVLGWVTGYIPDSFIPLEAVRQLMVKDEKINKAKKKSK